MMPTTATLPGTVTGTSAVNSATTAAARNTGSADADRFLTLLVAQLKNQDPMNPMDNAQMTSQMAQINTVTGIQQVNQSIQALTTMIQDYQGLNSLGLVGRDVLVPGQRIDLSSGQARGAFDLPLQAEEVSLDILSPGGQVLQSTPLGSMAAGRHAFSVPTELSGSNLNFRINALQSGQALTVSTLSHDQVQALSRDV